MVIMQQIVWALCSNGSIGFWSRTCSQTNQPPMASMKERAMMRPHICSVATITTMKTMLEGKECNHKVDVPKRRHRNVDSTKRRLILKHKSVSHPLLLTMFWYGHISFPLSTPNSTRRLVLGRRNDLVDVSVSTFRTVDLFIVDLMIT